VTAAAYELEVVRYRERLYARENQTRKRQWTGEVSNLSTNARRGILSRALMDWSKDRPCAMTRTETHIREGSVCRNHENPRLLLGT